MDLFTYLLGKKGQNTQRDLFSYLLGKGAGGSGTYVNFSGTSLNISNTLRARIKNIELKGATSQYTTTGKNLLQNNAVSQTINGVTFTKNEDGTIKVNGTATAQTIYNINESVVLNGTYIITGCPSDGADATYFLQIYGTGGVNEYGNGATTSNINAVLRIVIRNGATLNNLIFKPMIRLSSITDDTYEEYTGGQPSPSPEYPQPIKVVTGEQNVNVSGKNLWDENWHLGGISQTGGDYGSTTVIRTQSYIKIEPQKTYFVSVPLSNSCYAFYYDENKILISSVTITINTTTQYGTATTPDNTKYLRIAFRSSYGTTYNNDIIIGYYTKGVSTSYTPYYSKDYPLSFGSWNLLNYDLKTEFYYYNSSGIKTYDNIFKYINQRIEVGLGSSITCTAESMTSNALMRICEFASNDLFIKRSLVSTKERTITLDTNTSYIIVSIDKSNDRYFLKPQITKGTDIKPYYPYGEHYNENPLELAKIGTYQDYIYGTPNNWYKYKFIQKTIFDGSENWSLSSLGAGKFYVQTLPRFKVLNEPIGYMPYLTHFIGKINNDNFENGKALLYFTRTTDFLRLENDDTPTLAEWKAWLNDNNLTIYYLLNEPTNEQITDTTLIEQLNNLYNATSQEGTTYITCSSASDSNEIIVFSGDIKVASVGLGNPLNTSLLSSNIQEETNIDDIQEEPNVDEVNKIEDIEQNEEPIEEEVS